MSDSILSRLGRNWLVGLATPVETGKALDIETYCILYTILIAVGSYQKSVSSIGRLLILSFFVFTRLRSIPIVSGELSKKRLKPGG
jgi:hypothetical protein